MKDDRLLRGTATRNFSVATLANSPDIGGQPGNSQHLDARWARHRDRLANASQGTGFRVDPKHHDVVAGHVGAQQQLTARRDGQILRPFAEARFNRQ